MFAFLAGVTNIQALGDTPLWPMTESGSLYRSLLTQLLAEHPGFKARSYPVDHEALTEFNTKADLVNFLTTNKMFLADMMGEAAAYYTEHGCGIRVVLMTTGDPDIVIADPTNPDSFTVTL